jgi:hypothetical protein
VGHFRNDTSLSKSEIDTLVAWVNDGVPEGDGSEEGIHNLQIEDRLRSNPCGLGK